MAEKTGGKVKAGSKMTHGSDVADSSSEIMEADRMSQGSGTSRASRCSGMVGGTLSVKRKRNAKCQVISDEDTDAEVVSLTS